MTNAGTAHLFLCGAYDASTPIPDALPLPPAMASADFPPAHITHGYAAHDAKMIHAGLCSVVDDLGAVPIFGHTLSGNHNGKTGIAQQFQLRLSRKRLRWVALSILCN